MATLGEILKSARQKISASNIESASLDATLILSFLTNYSKVSLLIHDDDDVSDDLKDRYFSLIDKRASGYPTAYILGYKEFWGLKLKVNESTLIPRPDTETLVEAALNAKVKGKVLDLGTGSGAIILALRSEYRDDIDAFASDMSEDALFLARENAKILNLDVEFIHSDWFLNIPKEKFSLIVSNPPYIRDDDEHLNKTSLPFEPITALTSGSDGGDDIRIICKNAKDYLKEGAMLMVEHGYDQGLLISNIFEENGYRDVCTLKDLGGNDRVTLGRFCTK